MTLPSEKIAGIGHEPVPIFYRIDPLDWPHARLNKTVKNIHYVLCAYGLNDAMLKKAEQFRPDLTKKVAAAAKRCDELFVVVFPEPSAVFIEDFEEKWHKYVDDALIPLLEAYCDVIRASRGWLSLKDKEDAGL